MGLPRFTSGRPGQTPLSPHLTQPLAVDEDLVLAMPCRHWQNVPIGDHLTDEQDPVSNRFTGTRFR